MAEEAESAAGEAPLVLEEKNQNDPDNEFLILSQKYQVPPSPSGTDTITTHFGNGTLGDIMAAEFRDFKVKNPPPSSPDPSSDSDTDSDPESPGQGEADRTLLGSAIGLSPSIYV